MRILHVEDDRVDADLVARALHHARPALEVERVSSLGEARDLLHRPDRFDVALVDLRLPDGSGLELLNEIRDQQIALPVIMLTGSGDQTAAIAALQSGADDYVPKTIEAYARLHATIDAARARFGQRTVNRPHKLRVLYAEHHPADIDLARRHLARSAPYIRLTVVPDAVVALSHLPPDDATTADYDVVLLDYQLPGIDALEAVRTIRVERGLDIPIVIVSGQGSEQVAARAIHLGVDDYIVKHPGYLYELAPTLEKVHRQYTLMREQGVLRKTSQHLAYVLEASPAVLYTLRLTEGRTTATWVSANITRLFGYSEAEALAPGWWLAHVHPDDRGQAVRRWDAPLEQATDVREYRFLDATGTIHWVRDELRPLPATPDMGLELLGAWYDITAQKQAEQVQLARIATLDGLMRGQSLDQVLDRLAQQVEAALAGVRVALSLHDRQAQRLRTLASPSLPAAFSAAMDALPNTDGNGACGAAVRRGAAVITAEVRDDPAWANAAALAAQADVRACWAVPFLDEDGSVLGTFGVYHATPRAPQDQELQLIDEFAHLAGLAVQRANREADLRQAAAVLDSTNEGVVITDLSPRILSVNRAYTEITGYRADEVIGRNPSVLRSGRQDEAFYQAMWASIAERGYWRGEIWNRRRNGEVSPLLLTISTVRDPDGTPRHYVGIMTDISQIKQSEANLERLAHYDPLTGLPNRLLIQSRLEHSLTHACRAQTTVAVLFLDLDRFKNVNDSLGHPVGDHLLRALTQRLHSRLRGDDTFGRLGGDEFLVILDNCQRPEDAATIARELIGLLEAPFVLADHGEIYVGASIGIAVFPQDGGEAAQLIQHADAAMYQAKEQGRNTFRFYTPALTAAVNRRMELESRLRRALGNREFVLHYQPQVDIDSGAIVGCEALLRWDDPQSGLVPPGEFIPLAEETGLIVAIGEWVLDTACREFRRWYDAGRTDVCLAINLSARQLQQGDMAERIGATLRRHALPPQRVKFELTESSIMGQGAGAAELLAAIKAHGVRLSIDDFGTGYSSLAYLKRFPIDELKIDRSFVHDIPHDADDSEIAATIIAMAHKLRLRVVAEGVETEAQRQFLIGQGCQTYQGYLFSRPLPAVEFGRLLGIDD